MATIALSAFSYAAKAAAVAVKLHDNQSALIEAAKAQIQPLVLEHKRTIDEHLASIGIPVSYTNVFWGGRSEIKPSEISPIAYREWCAKIGVDPETMRE